MVCLTHKIPDRLVYVKTTCFETFPFPSQDTGLTPALTERIRSLAEQIDAHRKAQQAAHPELTLTGIYNVLEKLRQGQPLTGKDKTVHAQGLVSVLRSLHDELDAAVLQAYGWHDLGLVPWANDAHASAAHSTAQAAWTDALLSRLVELNARRAAEEAAGTVRWLRPEFQNPVQAPVAQQEALIDTAEDAAPTPPTPPAQQPWPTSLPEQIKLVAGVLNHSSAPQDADSIAAHFKGRGRWRERLPTILETLVAIGRVQTRDGGKWVA